MTDFDLPTYVSPDAPLSPDGLEAALRDIGARRYHNLHPFHRMLHDGELNRGQVQAWALNRYCYQAHIPRKDAVLMARLNSVELRREWRRRIVDHDGEDPGEGSRGGDDGGIERWLRLTTGLGLDRDYVRDMVGILPATKFAVEAYVHFVAEMPLLDAIASSLTELFAPTIISERVSGMLANYDFVDAEALAYFNKRLTQAPRDSGFALDHVRRHALRPDQQQAVLDALIFKCNVLWAQLDALHFAYVAPGIVPPGAFRP